MTHLAPSLAGLPNFGLYLLIGTGLTLVYAVIYIRITGHDELALIREHNASAAIALSGSLVGFAMPLSKAIAQASSIPDCIIWGTAALIVQLLAYGLTRLVIPDLSNRIKANSMATAVLLAAIAIVAGQINAAAMTYYPPLGGTLEAL